jgi:alkylated DNA repair protein alkB family protein 1
VPNLLPPRTQKVLLSRLLHRDLSNSEHLTNIHFHHKIPYPESGTSFFAYPHNNTLRCEPIDPFMHKPISLQSLLERRLRWMTLGGQYDWTAKEYPPTKPPTFPLDIAKFLTSLFPDIKAEAAIVNFYSPGDTLSIHRDIAEKSTKGLISISLGCDALFIIGMGSDHVPIANNSEHSPLVIRLRSGDAVLMTGPARFAWHGVAQIIPHTCPHYLENWPADDVNDHKNMYDHWRGWMKNKRVNLNVRQMWD